MYWYEDKLDEDADLQLWFGSEVVRLYLDRGSGSEDNDYVIVAATSPWVDPFAGSEVENEEYFRTHGRYKLIDVTSAPNYCELVGKPIDDVLPLFNDIGVCGVRLEVGDFAANIVDGGDEVAITWGDDISAWFTRHRQES